MGEIKKIGYTEPSGRKRSVVTADGIKIREINGGFKKGSYTGRTEIILTEDSEGPGDLASIGGNERFPVGTPKGIIEGSFMPGESRDTLHQETVEGEKGRRMTEMARLKEGGEGKKMEDNYCNKNNIAQ